MKLISTLICTYNAKIFLDSTIHSVLDQTYTNQEILIRDDWSTDGTIELLRQWAKKDNRIKLFIEPWTKRGPYCWLNYLLDNTKWDYIAIQDHDDIWHPQKLEKQINFLEKNKIYNACGALNTNYIMWDKLFRFHKKNKGKSLYIPHTTFFFKNTDIRYWNEEICTDRFFMRNFNIFLIDECLCVHRILPKKWNLSTQRSNASIKIKFSLFKKKIYSFKEFIYSIIVWLFPENIIKLLYKMLWNKNGIYEYKINELDNSLNWIYNIPEFKKHNK